MENNLENNAYETDFCPVCEGAGIKLGCAACHSEGLVAVELKRQDVRLDMKNQPDEKEYTESPSSEAKITAKIQGEDQNIVKNLKEKGINAKLVKNGVIIELQNNKGIYELLEEIDANGKLNIDITECGGGLTSRGSAKVVCGLSGKALKPYYMPRGGHLACGTHAYFSIPEAVVTVRGYKRDDNIEITEERIFRAGNTAKILAKSIWKGEMESLPNTFEKYKQAAEAAQRKAHCYHCRHVHYSA